VKPTRLIATGLILLAAAGSCWWLAVLNAGQTPKGNVSKPAIGRMVEIPSGTFTMGNALASSPDEKPAHEVFLTRYRIDEHEVTNGQFAQFADQTGYVSTAEQQGWSVVYDFSTGQWEKTAGASWRQPEGPGSSITGRRDWPVVHVSWYDATAYARWAGKRLPSEAQWERAARGGLRDASYPWGNEELIDGRFQANYRQHDMKPDADGYRRAAPVGSYPPGGFGLYDMSGNVWEWCADWYAADYYWSSSERDPQGPHQGSRRTIRGGSWLSPENFRLDHRVSTRASRLPDETYQNLGFRCVRIEDTSTR